MRSIPSILEAHLQSGTTTLTSCWKITRTDGTITGYTDHDETLTFDNVSFEAATGFVGTESLSRIGLSVDNMEIHAALSAGSLSETDLANGLYDNADVELYLVNWADVEQRILVRKGNIGEVRRGALSFMAEIRGLSHHLQQPEGRLFQSTCDAELGDARCQVLLNSASFTATTTLSAVGTDGRLETGGLAAYPTNWFRGGRIEWLTGSNSGAITEVKAHQKLSNALQILTLWRKQASLAQTGDQFKITAGCNKQFKTCRDKYANQTNFRGFPHIPGNDFIISTPNQDDGTQDGSSQN